jgi:hypothetical protein
LEKCVKISYMIDALPDKKLRKGKLLRLLDLVLSC